MTHALFGIIIVCILLIAYWIVQRFSPDPLITNIAAVIIFLVALWILVTKLLPLAGVSF